MANRRAIYLDGMNHGAPIPSASRVGPMLLSSPVHGNASDGSGIPDTIEEEAKNLIANCIRVVEAAGGSSDDIVKLRITVRDRDVRSALNPFWEAAFPDPETRPARHVEAGDPGAPHLHFTAEVIAFIAD